MTTRTVPDQAGLKRLGARVRKRLAADPLAWQVPTDKAEIFAIGDFLTPAECRRFIELVDLTAEPSKLFDTDYSAGFRTSYSGDLDPHDSFVKGVSRRIDDLLGLRAEFGESIQGQRYLPGQEFQPHHDWFYPDTSYWEMEMARGGQRSFTAMAFLNEVEEGGTTDFTELGISIEPQPGALLIWNNATPDGLPNEATMHAGRPVVQGVKYVITKWFRTMKWN